MNGSGNGLRPATIMDKKMNMVGCDYVVEYLEPIGFFCPEKPSQPSQFIFLELEEKFFLMAPMGNMPDVFSAGKKMSFGSGHESKVSLNRRFWLKKISFKRNSKVEK
jgi:hypothetical protein